jgi:hypothetical protein
MSIAATHLKSEHFLMLQVFLSVSAVVVIFNVTVLFVGFLDILTVF